MLWLLVIIWYIGCCVLSYGLVLYSFTEKFPYMKHYDVLWTSILGPFALIGGFLFILMEKEATIGLRFRHLPYNERLQIFNSRSAMLGKDWFDARHK